MEGRARVLGANNGSFNAPLLFVGEAPGRLGADQTGTPFCGDRSGREFERLLAAAGLTREDVFITNAVLCNPRDDVGRNARPHRGELHNCSGFLRETIDLVDPEIVVTLGAEALQALAAIESHEIALRTGVASPVRWYTRLLIPLYHPGARAQIHRSIALQREDYVKLGCLFRETCGVELRAGRDHSLSRRTDS